MFRPLTGMSYNIITVPHPDDKRDVDYISRIVATFNTSGKTVSAHGDDDIAIMCMSDHVAADIATQLINGGYNFTHTVEQY